MSALKITGKNFRQEVLESEKTVLLDFFAAWCGPCRMVGPILDEIAAERPDIKVCKIDVDEEAQLAAEFHVVSVPTLMVLENGKVKNQSTGAKSKQQILQMLN